jgi:hypothetical protein
LGKNPQYLECLLQREAGWLWPRTFSATIKSDYERGRGPSSSPPAVVSPQDLAPTLAKFDPFITHLMRLYANTNVVETRRAVYFKLYLHRNVV